MYKPSITINIYLFFFGRSNIGWPRCIYGQFIGSAGHLTLRWHSFNAMLLQIVWCNELTHHNRSRPNFQHYFFTSITRDELINGFYFIMRLSKRLTTPIQKNCYGDFTEYFIRAYFVCMAVLFCSIWCIIMSAKWTNNNQSSREMRERVGRNETFWKFKIARLTRCGWRSWVLRTQSGHQIFIAIVIVFISRKELAFIMLIGCT